MKDYLENETYQRIRLLLAVESIRCRKYGKMMKRVITPSYLKGFRINYFCDTCMVLEELI